MSSTLNMQLTGMRELRRTIGSVEPKLKKQGLKQALRKGAEISLARAKALAPWDQMQRSLMVRNMTGLKRGAVGVRVTFRKSAKLIHITKSGARYFIPFAIEYGHAGPYHTVPRGEAPNPRLPHRESFGPKQIPPHPSIRPAFDETRGQAAQVVENELAAFIAAKVWVG